MLMIMMGFFASCGEDEVQSDLDWECRNNNLETIDDNEDCGDVEFFLVCESVIVEEINYLTAEDFAWIPSLCKDKGESIEFRNSLNESFSITIVDKGNYINKRRVNTFCNLSMEHGSYICQSNESAFIEFSSSIFGNNITRFELYNVMSEVQDGVVSDPQLHFTLEQPRFNTLVHNFYYPVPIGNESETRSKTFHDELTLNGFEFESVYEMKIRETFWAEPHMSVFINHGDGILGFKKDNKFWVKGD